jgi:hypothetical protein
MEWTTFCWSRTPLEQQLDRMDFLHHVICLDVEVGDDGVDVRRRSGRGLRG